MYYIDARLDRVIGRYQEKQDIVGKKKVDSAVIFLK